MEIYSFRLVHTKDERYINSHVNWVLSANPIPNIPISTKSNPALPYMDRFENQNCTFYDWYLILPGEGKCSDLRQDGPWTMSTGHSGKQALSLRSLISDSMKICSNIVYVWAYHFSNCFTSHYQSTFNLCTSETLPCVRPYQMRWAMVDVGGVSMVRPYWSISNRCSNILGDSNPVKMK